MSVEFTNLDPLVQSIADDLALAKTDPAREAEAIELEELLYVIVDKIVANLAIDRSWHLLLAIRDLLKVQTISRTLARHVEGGEQAAPDVWC